MSTKIQVSVTKIIQFKFVYTVEQLAKWFQVNPEAILADLENYAEAMSRDNTLDIVLPLIDPSSEHYRVDVLGTKDLEVTQC